MKRIVSLLLAVSMVFGMFATVFAAATYSDLTGDNIKYAGAVEALTELKVDGQSVINGYPDGTFGPEKTVTRAELAKMLVVCLGLGSEVEALATKSVFSDVPTTHWAAGWINAAAQSKVIVGYPDGTFQPDKTVSYAEAITMALRALGYGNVADFEGTWPTSYMLKAVELELTRDMEGVKADVAATRGNIAILLWNMLRTPMWKVTEESENSGMTLSNRNEQLMLNVKFPDYAYADEVYVEYVDVADMDDVTIGILDAAIDGVLVHAGEAQIRNVDISRIVPGMKVTALVKLGRKGEDNTYVTLTPEGTRVEGLITKVSDDGEKITVNDEEYRLTKGNLPDGVTLRVDDYVVFEAEGKKVNTYEFAVGQGSTTEYVIKNLPIGGTEVDDLKAALRKIKEDSLVIKNGEWVDREEIEEGDVYTELKDDFDGSYWMVTDERLDSTLDSYTVKTVKGEDSHLLTLDGDEVRSPRKEDLEAYEGADNDKDVKLSDIYDKKAKDNKYLGADVEVVLDYLGNPVILYFGDIDDLNNGGSFYAIVNGIWEESGKGGTTRKISLVGMDGEGGDAEAASEGVDYSFKKNAYDEDLHGDLDGDTVLAEGTPIFAWANFDADGETIKTLVPLFNGLESGDESGYKNKYTIAAISGEVKDGKLGEFKVSSSTVVMAVTPIEDPEFEGRFEGFAVEITEGIDNKTEVPEGSFVAYDASKKVLRAAYIFIAKDPESAEMFYGLVEDYDSEKTAGINYVTINGERYELAEDEGDFHQCYFEEGWSVGFTELKGVIKVRESWAWLAPGEISDDMNRLFIIDKETESDTIVFTDGSSLDLGEKSDDIDNYEDYKVVEIALSTESDNATLVFDSVEEIGEGLLKIPNKKGVRVILPDFEDNDLDEVIIVLTGIKDKETIHNGKLVDETDADDDDDDDDDDEVFTVSIVDYETEMESGDEYEFEAVVYDESGEPVDGATVAWSSSDEDVATVSDGIVNAIASGTATITATYGDASDDVTVTVFD